MSDVPDLPAEQSKIGKTGEVLLEGAAGAVPVFGGIIAATLAAVFGSVHEKRTRDWMEEMRDVVQELIDHVEGLNPHDLLAEPEFYDAVITTTRIATGTSSEAKHHALQNALYNIGSGGAPDIDKRTIYLRYVDELTPSHIALLTFLNNPPAYYAASGMPWPDIYAGGLNAVIDPAFPAWAADQPFLNTLASDLGAMGLSASPSLSGVMTGEGLRASRTTEKGKEFIRFISGPFDGHDSASTA